MFLRCRRDGMVFSQLVTLIENNYMLTIDGDIHLGVPVAEVEIEMMLAAGLVLDGKSEIC